MSISQERERSKVHRNLNGMFHKNLKGAPNTPPSFSSINLSAVLVLCSVDWKSLTGEEGGRRNRLFLLFHTVARAIGSRLRACKVKG